jgi:hypothetical protein
MAQPAPLSPGLARVPGSMKILISSVHKRSGLLYQRYRDFYGKERPPFNPSEVVAEIVALMRQEPQWAGRKNTKLPFSGNF